MAQHAINMAKKAVDPTFIPTIELDLVEGCHQYLSKIVEGLDEYFHCRRKDCLCIALATEWPNNSGGQYACPQCGEQYQAWFKSAMRSKSNKVINRWIQ